MRFLRRGNARALSALLAVALVSAAFSPATTGCSGGPGATSDSSLSTSQKGTVYYIDDHLGSAQLLTDSEGNVVYEGLAAPYGLDLDGLGTGATEGEGDSDGPDYSYTTKERDEETGLIYFGKRYYSPEMGRWITPDPLFLERPDMMTQKVLSANLYIYVRNNPVSMIDPFGLDAWSITSRWDVQQIQAYSNFMGDFISNYSEKVDCADLGLKGLIDFASQNKLPLTLKYWADGRWDRYNASSDDFTSTAQFEDTVLKNLGALNIIDNTSAIEPPELQTGDFIMSSWSSTLGHTRVVHSAQHDPVAGSTDMIWYQGNLPPVIPERRSGELSAIDPGMLPSSEATRRWNFGDWNP